jgi:AAA domain
LRPDQDVALAHATGAGNLKLIEGRAGTGKSYTLAAIRDAHAADGKRVVGLALTNAVAQDLAADGFFEAGTVHAALFGLKNGRTRWDRNTVVVVDEAAMLDTPVTGELWPPLGRPVPSLFSPAMIASLPASGARRAVFRDAPAPRRG